MELTVGILEDKLRKFSKGTSIHVSCGVCHHGALGNESILEINDNTNQTFGYIELNLNASSESNVELTVDKEEFYKAEIEKLKKQIMQQKIKLLEYEDTMKSIKSSAEYVLK